MRKWLVRVKNKGFGLKNGHLLPIAVIRNDLTLSRTTLGAVEADLSRVPEFQAPLIDMKGKP
ncbi:hypothetical protein [Neisseria shayeganii]|uniref:hypothetical protein n=1 Tax=Neisseria shayeganii TaxID=607712 RepID=UPI0012EA68CB|nr:hypothetical protein [Neisseria shayeganii]